MNSYVADSEITAVRVTPRRHLGCDGVVVSAFPGHYKTKRIQLTAAMAGVPVEFVDAREVQFVHCAVQKYPMARVIEYGGPPRREWFIFTTPAICRYIAHLRRDCSLLGIGSEMEAAVDSTMDFITQELEVPIALLIYRSLGSASAALPSFPVLLGDISPSKMVAKRASREIEEALKRMNHLLREEDSNGFLVPGTASVSVADIFAITVLSEGISHDLVTIGEPRGRRNSPREQACWSDETDCPQVALWLDRMAQLPLVQKFVFGQSDSFRTAPGLAVDASALPSAPEREGRKAENTPSGGTARTVPPVDIPRVAFGGRNGDTIKLSGRQDDLGVVASKVRRWEGKVSGSSTAAPAFLVAKKAPPFPSEGEAQRLTSSPVASGSSGNRMSTSRDLDDSEIRPLAGSGRAERGPTVHAGSSPVLRPVETPIGAKTNGASSNSMPPAKNLASSVFMKLLPSPRPNRASQLREARGAALRHGRPGKDGPGRSARPKAMRLPSGNSKLPANNGGRVTRRPLAGWQGTEASPSGSLGGTGVAVEESLKVTKSARGRLEGGAEASEGMAPAAAFISLPIRRRSKGSVEFFATDEHLQDVDESSHHFSSGLWPQGDIQTVVAELRGEDQDRAVKGEDYSNPNSDFVEEESRRRDLPESNASPGPSEATEHPVGKLQEHEEFDRGRLEPEGKTGEEQDAESFVDQRLIKMMTEGQHFGRNSDRRRLPTAGRFGTLSLKMEPESPTVAERVMWSAPVPPPEANEAPVLPAMDRAASRAASALQREATHQERDQAIALRFYDGAREGPVEQRPRNSRGSLPRVMMIGPSSARLPHAALFGTSWRPTLAAYSSFASIPGFLGDTPERQASLGTTTATRQSIPPTLVQRRTSIPSSGAYKHVLSPKLTVLPPATQLIVGGREDPRGGVPGRTGDQNPGRHVNHHFLHHHKRPPGHTEHHATRHGGQHHYAGMEVQNTVRWENYHLIVPPGGAGAAEQDTDVRGQLYHSGRWGDPMTPHTSWPAVMELLIFVPDAIVYSLSTTEDEDDSEWTQLDVDGGFTVTRSVGAAEEEHLCAAVVSLDGTSFEWSVKIDMRVSPECHGHTFHFRSTDGSVLAVWCSQPNTADRIMARVMSAFREEPLPRREAGDDSGMSELLEILKKPISASASAALLRGYGKLKQSRGGGAATNSNTLARSALPALSGQEEVPQLSFDGSHPRWCPTVYERSVDRHYGTYSYRTEPTNGDNLSQWLSPREGYVAVDAERLRSALRATLSSDDFVENVLGQLRPPTQDALFS